MVISLDDAVAILNKWKDESANLLVAAESPFSPDSARDRRTGRSMGYASAR
jgi:hypothetical protein